MPAQLIDGNVLSKKLRTEIAARAAIVTAKGLRPGLAVILVGENAASQVYVRNKVKACEESGFHSVLERYSAEMAEEELLARIATLNADPSYSPPCGSSIPEMAITSARGKRKLVDL